MDLLGKSTLQRDKKQVPKRPWAEACLICSRVSKMPSMERSRREWEEVEVRSRRMLEAIGNSGAPPSEMEST